VKIVHLTDIHIQKRPHVRQIWNKRMVGSFNLYVLGRHNKFTPTVQQAAVAATIAEEPDAVVITGDLTAQALPSEFAAAHALLEPILSRFPTFIIPGNHDTYVSEPEPGAMMREVFGEWMGPTAPHLHTIGDVGFLHVETCRAALLSSGHSPPAGMPAARSLLEKADQSLYIFLCLHYPLRGRDGAPYGPAVRALANANELETELLMKTDRIDAVLHGHEHHGYRTEVPTAAGPRPSINPGSSGYAHIPTQNRTAHFNVYTIKNRSMTTLRRMHFDGTMFAEEPGGAYATGR
jgi:3',5'-cyclic AMP phosphodiesterase CpdA